MKLEHDGIYKVCGQVSGNIFGTIESVFSIESAIFKFINIFKPSVVEIIVFHYSLFVPWESWAIDDSMSWGMFLANLAVATETVWFPVRVAVAREAGQLLGGGWFHGSWGYRLSKAASAGVPISLASAPGNVIINIGCYDFEQLSDNCLYSCLVLGKLSIVYSHSLGSRFNLSSPRVPLVSGIVLEVLEQSSAVNKLSSSYRTWLVTTGLYT